MSDFRKKAEMVYRVNQKQCAMRGDVKSATSFGNNELNELCKAEERMNERSR